MKHNMNGIVKISNSHNAVPLMAELFFLIVAICFFPLLLLFIPFYFYPGPEPATPVFATNRTVVSMRTAVKRRERSPPQ
ncbi:MAG: hypothetical protein KJ808_00865 [Acidobacteria bacterium]|nr:hypothetical protein [Acidobacteriota bacterium]MBU4307281.1 hypothetical protein [Acidobacteriota bacterium]MBU4405652.1 hypothetical protein [Acidobacteriota bacterium]